MILKLVHFYFMILLFFATLIKYTSQFHVIFISTRLNYFLFHHFIVYHAFWCSFSVSSIQNTVPSKLFYSSRFTPNCLSYIMFSWSELNWISLPFSIFCLTFGTFYYYNNPLLIHKSFYYKTLNSLSSIVMADVCRHKQKNWGLAQRW